MVSLSIHYRRMIAVLLLLIVALSMMPLANISTVAKAQSGSYKTPITIVERSGNNLNNYPVRILLTPFNFSQWDSLSNNGSDIYFTDTNGNPLYYWIDTIKKTPDIQANYITVGIQPTSYGGSALEVWIYTDQWIQGTNFRVENGVPKADFNISLVSGKTITRVALRHSSIRWNDPTQIWIWDDKGNQLYYTSVSGHLWDQSFPNYFEYVSISYQVPNTIAFLLAWVKVPYIPANGATTIYMYYGGTNPYASYNDPTKVFLLYDDFTDITGWTAVKTSDPDNNGAISVGSASGTYLNVTISDNGGGYGTWGYAGKNYNISTSFPFELRVKMYYNAPGLSSYHTVGVGVIVADSAGNTYRVLWSAGGDNIPGPNANYAADQQHTISMNVKTWYVFSFYPISTLSGAGYTFTLTSIRTIFVGMEVYNSIDNAYVDYIIVRSYVNPEPLIILGWVPGIKSQYYTPLTIVENSGSSLTNYAVKVTLNSNFDGWSNIANFDGSDIYFTDQNNNPLYYWIEGFDIANRQAVIWVKLPYIPANGTTTIYMYYGGANPYSSYNNPYNVFTFFDHFSGSSLSSAWSSTIINYGTSYTVSSWSKSLSGSLLQIAVTGGDIWIGSQFPFLYVNVSLSSFAVEVKYQSDNMASLNKEWVKAGVLVSASDYSYVSVFVRGYNHYLQIWEGYKGTSQIEYDGSRNISPPFYLELRFTPSQFEAYYSTDLFTWSLWKSWTPYHSSFPLIGLTATSQGSGTVNAYFDYIYVRPHVSPEPSVNIGLSIPLSIIYLPQESIILEHDLAYSPNSTQFVHSFTATDTSNAGYATNFSDAYGWMVYANPSSGGVNNASLVSNVSISLPYSSILVDNITLLARTNGTGNYRQLWIRALDSNGAVVSELTNTTIGTDWTQVVLPVSTSLSNQITVWINATAGSSASSGEEIDVRDVMVYARYVINPPVSVKLTTDPGFQVSIKHDVYLGSTDYLNYSAITFKLVQYLTYNNIDYPTQPTYIGSETIGSYSYSVYTVDPANYTQTMTIYASLENKLRNARTHVGDYNTFTVLIGEPLTISLPVVSNITIKSLNVTYVNVQSISLNFSSSGSYVIEANVTQPSAWMLGYWVGNIAVSYGGFSIRPLDLDSKNVDYENLVVQLVNKTSGQVIMQANGKKLFSFGNLTAGNYTLIAKFNDIIVGSGDFQLGIANNGSTISLPCTMKVLTDYRGINRSIIYGMDKQLQSVESLSDKYPYSRMRVLLNGTGSFTLYMNYYGDLPTRIMVSGNVSGLKYYWNGNYLVIKGTLGSLGELNITDLYKISVETYDRLNNYMQSWMYGYINETEYSGAVIQDYYYPDDYVIKLPDTINGFQFYRFFDGFNNTIRMVNLNDTDIVLKAWYRIPTNTEVNGYQVTSLFLPLFTIKQNGETAAVYIDGVLKDYYGNGVPNRPLTINVTDPKIGFAMAYNVTTDTGGHFRSPLMQLIRGETYNVVISYNGDDIYIGTIGSTNVKPEELPVSPLISGLSTEYLIAGIAIVAIIIGVVATVRAIRHTIEDISEENRKFVKKK